jgi:hypothetical protein
MFKKGDIVWRTNRGLRNGYSNCMGYLECYRVVSIKDETKSFSTHNKNRRIRLRKIYTISDDTLTPGNKKDRIDLYLDTSGNISDSFYIYFDNYDDATQFTLERIENRIKDHLYNYGEFKNKLKESKSYKIKIPT